MITTTYKQPTEVELAKLELIAQNQTVSPRASEVPPAAITSTEPLPLDTYLEKAQSFFSRGLSEVYEDDEADYLDWAADLIIYCGKRLCSATQAELGEVFGYTKGQAFAIGERIERKIMKQARKGNHDLLLFLNEFRKSLAGESTFCGKQVQIGSTSVPLG